MKINLQKRFLPPSKKIWISALISILLFIGYGIFFHKDPTSRFRQVTEELFYEEMTASTLNMHYTLADPSRYGIQDYEAVLPCYNKENQSESMASLETLIRFYEGIDSSKLSARDACTLTLLCSYLKTTLELGQYPYFEEPLSPSSGMQSQLPILLAEYPFRRIRDVEDYLAILSQTGNYFSSLLEFEAEKKKAGLLMAAGSLYEVAEQCRTLLTAEDLKQNRHFLQITFRERLQTLCQSASEQAPILTESQIDAYIQQNDQILTEILLPAYESLAEGLTALADPSVPLAGLAARPNGEAYYEILLKSETGSHWDIHEISQLLTKQLEQEYSQLCSLLQTIDPAYLTEEAYQQCNSLFSLETSGEMLTDLQKRMAGLFPDFPESADKTPSIHVKEVVPCLQDYCAPAFYLTPPLDDSNHNSIYINPKTTISAIDLYTTLAHEGYPGHMYQTVYSNRLMAEQDFCPIRQVLWFGGYLEGWALYVEFMAYDYAAEILRDLHQPEYAQLLEIEKHNRSTQLCLYALLDILIHHENTDLAGTAEILANFGITNSASVSAIYKYIVEEPANYPKYYLGYLEILLLKETCQRAWGEYYSEYNFHKFFLDKGPADFQTLNSLVEE